MRLLPDSAAKHRRALGHAEIDDDQKSQYSACTNRNALKKIDKD